MTYVFIFKFTVSIFKFTINYDGLFATSDDDGNGLLLNTAIELTTDFFRWGDNWNVTNVLYLVQNINSCKLSYIWNIWKHYEMCEMKHELTLSP